MILIFINSVILCFLIFLLLNSLNKNDNNPILSKLETFDIANKTENSVDYEYYIQNLYKQEGYEVNSESYGSIDMVANKNNQIMLVCCKNTDRSLEQDELEVFIKSCDIYINENLSDTGKQITKVLITNYPQISQEISKYIKKINEENSIKTEYKIIINPNL